MLIRLYFVTDDYRVYDRVLGWKKDFEGGASGLLAATSQAIDDFCTISPPGLPRQPLDLALKTKTKQITHGADVDGAFDEQRCIRDLQKTGVLPNMVRVGTVCERSSEPV